MERCSIHLLYITELRFYIRVIFDAYRAGAGKEICPLTKKATTVIPRWSSSRGSFLFIRVHTESQGT